MRFNRKFVVAMTAAMALSAVPVTTYGEVIVYSPSKTTTTSTTNTSKTDTESKEVSLQDLINSGKLTVEQIAQMGPGYASAIVDEFGEGLEEAIKEENKEFDGPTVNEVKLQENYNDTYKTYEESMADLFFMYSNVGNGGMTHEPVIIDIPANISYSMEKDGLPYEYVSQTYITAKGTYVMKLSGVKNSDAPLSEQVEYTSTFRFRITDEPPVEETEVETEATAVTANSSFVVSGSSGAPVIVMPETSAALETEPETIIETEASDENKESSNDPESKPESEPDSKPEEDKDANIPAEREQSRDSSTGNYIITFENGKKLVASVPEGYVGAGSVDLSVAEGDEIITKLYKNDELIDFVNNSSVSENGRYRVEMDGCSYFFTLAYEVGAMDYYPAPVGMAFTEVRLNDELLTLATDQYVAMEEDGTYSFVMKGKDGERLETALLKDTVAPEMSVSTNKSTASIQYLSKDIDRIELLKDGAVVSGFNANTITEPGNYKLTVYDAAGNSASASFSLKYQVNLYGVLAVVLVILAVAGVGAFVVYTKKNTKVR